MPTNSRSRSVLYGSIVRCAGISGLFQEFRDGGVHLVTDRAGPLPRSAYGAPMGPSRPIVCAGSGAGSWGLAHRNVTREYSESICSLEGLIASGLKERVEDLHELEPATTAKSGCWRSARIARTHSVRSRLAETSRFIRGVATREMYMVATGAGPSGGRGQARRRGDGFG